MVGFLLWTSVHMKLILVAFFFLLPGLLIRNGWIWLQTSVAVLNDGQLFLIFSSVSGTN